MTRSNSKRQLYLILGLLFIILIAAFWIFYKPKPPKVSSNPPSPISGFAALVPPISDSFPIGKTFIKGTLSGQSSRNIRIHRSWDLLFKNGIIKDTLDANSKIKDLLNIAFNGKKQNIEVTNVSGINYYESTDYSELDLPDSTGFVVVAAAVAAREFSFKISSGIDNILQ